MKTLKQFLTESIKLRFGVERVPDVIIKRLGTTFSDDLVGYDFADKGFYLKFRSKTTKKELAQKLGIAEFDITDEGNWTFFIYD